MCCMRGAVQCDRLRGHSRLLPMGSQVSAHRCLKQSKYCTGIRWSSILKYVFVPCRATDGVRTVVCPAGLEPVFLAAFGRRRVMLVQNISVAATSMCLPRYTATCTGLSNAVQRVKDLSHRSCECSKTYSPCRVVPPHRFVASASLVEGCASYRTDWTCSCFTKHLRQKHHSSVHPTINC